MLENQPSFARLRTGYTSRRDLLVSASLVAIARSRELLERTAGVRDAHSVLMQRSPRAGRRVGTSFSQFPGK